MRTLSFVASATVILLGLGITSTANATPLSDQPVSTSKSQNISITGLDLTNEQDWAIAEIRVRQAAEAVCTLTNPDDIATSDDVASCTQKARHNATSTLNDIRTAQLTHHQTGHVEVATSTLPPRG